MSSRSRHRAPPLSLVSEASNQSKAVGDLPRSDLGDQAPAREINWSILMARAQSGDGLAYRRLLLEITPYLRMLTRRHHRDPADVEDTVQDVLLTVHAVRETYDPNRPFGPWLVAIARRRIVDRLRHQGRATSREVALGDEHETFSTVEANLGEAACNRRVLDDAVEHLPPSQRQAIRLLKLQEMTLKEAAAVSGMTIVSLKVATHRALRNLRKMLTERGDKR